MPRHSTFQTLDDTNTKTISGYEIPIPTSTDIDKANEEKPRVVTEKIRNIFGSSAGAGSSEFHLYTLSRKREITRIEQLERKDATEKEIREFREKMENNKKIEEERLKKNAEKRKKKKMKKLLKRKSSKKDDDNSAKKSAEESEEGESADEGDNVEEKNTTNNVEI